jgi:hypothetical protein
MRNIRCALLLLSIVLVSCVVPKGTPISSEGSDVRAVVEDFGGRLQAVSLQSP